MGIFRKLIDSEYKELKRFEKIANEIMAKEDSLVKLSDDELKNKTKEFKERLESKLRSKALRTAPPEGLYLARICYDEAEYAWFEEE